MQAPISLNFLFLQINWRSLRRERGERSNKPLKLYKSTKLAVRPI